MDPKFWTWARKRREDKAIAQVKLITALSEAFSRSLRDGQLSVIHRVTHAPRPPAPRPERIKVIYDMQDGREYCTFIPLHGQAQWIESWPSWLNPENNSLWPPVAIRYHLGYADS